MVLRHSRSVRIFGGKSSFGQIGGDKRKNECQGELARFYLSNCWFERRLVCILEEGARKEPGVCPV